VEFDGILYDNVLVSGNSKIDFYFIGEDGEDINLDDNHKEVDILYENSGSPVVTQFKTCSSYCSYYAPNYYGGNMFAIMGETVDIIMTATDDMQVKEVILQYRSHNNTTWKLLSTYQHDDTYFHKTDKSLLIPTDIEPTDDAQIRAIFIDDTGLRTEKITDPFSIYSNQLDATIKSVKSSYQIEEDLIFEIDVNSIYNYGIQYINVDLECEGTIGKERIINKKHSDAQSIDFSEPFSWYLDDFRANLVSDSCQAKLTIRDIYGNERQDILSNIFSISLTPIEAAFEVNLNAGFAPLTIEFTDMSQGNIETWLWNFGIQQENSTQNETSTEQNPSFTYEKPDTYTVKLTVTDKNGQEETIEKEIVVKELQLVPLMVRANNNTMSLDWSEDSIKTYIADPDNAVIKFWREPEGTGNWQLVDTIDYMDSSLSTNQYFDRNTIEPKMNKDEKYCYYFEVVNSSDTELLAQSEVSCETFGIVVIFIDKIASAGPGDEVIIPVKTANFQDFQVKSGYLTIVLNNKNVIDPYNMSIVLNSLLVDDDDYPLYEFCDEIGNQPNEFICDNLEFIEIDGNSAVISFPFNGNWDEKLFGGQENFFSIKSTVIGDYQDSTEIQWDTTKSFMYTNDGSNIDVSFGNTSFNVRRVRKPIDSATNLVDDGYFVVDAIGRLGDANLNAIVDPNDEDQVLNYVVDRNFYPLTSKQLAAADANGNGKIDASDAAFILYYSFTKKWPSIYSVNGQSVENNLPVIVKLGNISAESGTEVEIQLSAENLNNFVGGEFILSYPPTVEAVLEVNRTRFTRKFSVKFSDNNEGQVRIAMVSREPISGDGELAILKLLLKPKTETKTRKRTVRDGNEIVRKTSNFVLSQVQLYDLYGRNFVTSRLQLTVERQNGQITLTDVPDDTKTDLHPASCQAYAVNDEGLNNSQFFTISCDGDVCQIKELGPLYEGYDFESIAIHPETNMIYAVSGHDADINATNAGDIYIVDGENGNLYFIGNTGFNDIEDATFLNNDLMASDKNAGFITIDISTGISTQMSANNTDYSNYNVGGLTLNGMSLYAYENSDQKLYKYDLATNITSIVCDNLTGLGEVEALEVLSDDILMMGIDGKPNLYTINLKTCQTNIGISTKPFKFKDVEGIAIPVNACTE